MIYMQSYHVSSRSSLQMPMSKLQKSNIQMILTHRGNHPQLSNMGLGQRSKIAKLPPQNFPPFHKISRIFRHCIKPDGISFLNFSRTDSYSFLKRLKADF